MVKLGDLAVEYLQLQREPSKDPARLAELRDNALVQFALLDAQANVFCPACKLWNTGHGANMMREAVSLMGGYGVTEDCPGFLGHKWMDAQLEATYEGPEAVQRRQMSITMTNPVFLAQYEGWIRELRGIASDHPDTGACLLASAMTLWLWTLRYLQEATDANGAKLLLPAPLTPAQQAEGQKWAALAFQTLECEGMGRVDFFLDRNTGAFYFNEVNTLPGFTSISMYPKMWEQSGMGYVELLSRLVDLAWARAQRKRALVRDFLQSESH
jgi:hypothetical protein